MMLFGLFASWGDLMAWHRCQEAVEVYSLGFEPRSIVIGVFILHDDGHFISMN